MSCHFSPSWHCQKIRGWGWLARAGVPTRPAEEEREVRSKLTVKHFSCLAEKMYHAVHHVFPFLPKPTKFHPSKKFSHVNMLNRSFRHSAMCHGTVGSTLVDCSTVVIFVRGTRRVGPAKITKQLD